MSANFVHLGVHSEYSLTDSLIRLQGVKRARDDDRLEPLAKRAARLDFDAIALTDHSNLFGLVKFYKSVNSSGIKPVSGADVWIKGEPDSEVTLLVQNETGYRNLTRLISASYMEHDGGVRPHVSKQQVFDLSDGLIVLLGSRSELAEAFSTGDVALCSEKLEQWKSVFGDRLYLAVQRCGRPLDELYTQGCAALSKLHSIGLVATNDVRFLAREDFDAHEARVCVNQGRTIDDPRRSKDYTPEQYLKSSAEMCSLFADMPEAIANTVEIAKRCTFSIEFGVNHLPEFPLPDNADPDNYLRQQAVEGLRRRIIEVPPVDYDEKIYADRLDYELGIIQSMGFAGYFLIVADFIQWGKENGVPVGPGRGSGAGSLVAYATGITDIDPIPFSLLFERFLNPERVSMPDFDIDFCIEGRDRVIEYVTQRYGKDRVSQIITYGSMAARAVIRDATRVLGKPHPVGDRIAKMVPAQPAFKTQAAEAGCSELEHALNTIPELKAESKNEESTDIIELSLLLEGLTRGVGKHAGGVVIAPKALTEYAPLYKDADSEGAVTQFDMKDVESVGLVKFDFLGLRTLTIINGAVKLINHQREKTGEEPLNILSLPLDDVKVYEMFGQSETTAVFQMESAGIRRLSIDLKPSRFEDLVALVALFRPGPLNSGMAKDFIERKHGLQKITYPHPALETQLKETYGTIVYQEQVMGIARELAGYSLGGADLLRRAMGKKIASEMAQQRSIFVDGAKERGADEQVASQIFDLMEKFAEYGFNKSHSAAYALIAYQTSWLKAYYPAEFMCSVLSAEMLKTDSLVMMVAECERMGVEVLPPDVNESEFKFSVQNGKIRYGLGAMRGVGEGAVEGLINARSESGKFRDLFDFCDRIDTRKANKRVLETLINGGALDCFKLNRPSLLSTLTRALSLAEQKANNEDAGQVDLFGLGAPAGSPATITQSDSLPDWDDLHRLSHERDALGFYLTGHPIETWRPVIQQIAGTTIGGVVSEIPAPSADPDAPKVYSRKKSFIGAWVTDVRRVGKRAAITLDDKTGQLTCFMSEDMWDKYRLQISKDQLLFVKGRVSPDEYSGGYQLRLDEIHTLDSIYQRYLERIVVSLEPSHGLDEVEHLFSTFKNYRTTGGCAVSVTVDTGIEAGILDLPPEWRVQASDSCISRLKATLGSDRVRVQWRMLDDGGSVH